MIDVDENKESNNMEKTSARIIEVPCDNRVPETKVHHSNDSKVQDVAQPVANIQQDVNEQLSDGMDVIQTAAKTYVEDISSLVEEEEQFPESGPV